MLSHEFRGLSEHGAILRLLEMDRQIGAPMSSTW